MISLEQQRVIREVLSPYEPRRISIFGSYARGEAGPDSDLDLLIDLGTELDLLDLIGLEQELGERLGIKVDLVTERSLNERLRPYVMRDLIAIDAAA